MMTGELNAQQIADRLINRLEGVEDYSTRGYYKAFCPSHFNRDTPALSIKLHHDGIGVKCHAGCTTREVVEAVGLEVKDLFVQAELVDDTRPTRTRREPAPEPQPPRKEKKAYEYQDADGNTLYRVLRTPDKKFPQQTPDGSGGWKNGLNGTKPVLYRLPALVSAKRTAWVFVVEGEKDADRLAELGLIATTSPMGAGKWRPEYSEFLKDRTVFILPDNDKAGREHAEAVAATLPGSVILQLPNLPEKGDVSDWLDAGGSKEKLLALAADAGPTSPEHEFHVYSFAELMQQEFEPVRYVVEDLLPEGTMMLAGKPKMGKSWLGFGLCICVATGTRALKHFEVDQGNALYLALEDNQRRLQDRGGKIINSLAAGGRLDLSRLDYKTYAQRLDEGLIQFIQHWCEDVADPRLVVIDTIARIRPRGAQDRRQLYDQDYEVGELLTDVAAEYGIAIVPVGHTKKGDADDPLDLISGSTGLTGGMDGAMVLNRTRSAADAVLRGVHRELEHDPDYALIWRSEEGLWEYAGDAEEYMMSKERRQILEVLANADDPMKPKDIAEALDKLTPSVTKLLDHLPEHRQAVYPLPGLGIVGRPIALYLHHSGYLLLRQTVLLSW